MHEFTKEEKEVIKKIRKWLNIEQERRYPYCFEFYESNDKLTWTGTFRNFKEGDLHFRNKYIIMAKGTRVVQNW